MSDFSLTTYRAKQAAFRAEAIRSRIPILAPQIDALKREIQTLLKQHAVAKNKVDKDHIRDAYSKLFVELAPIEHEHDTLKAWEREMQPAAPATEKVAIVGSRDYPDLDAVYIYVGTLPANTTVISGGARGVDSMAAEAARAHGLALVEYLPDWDQYGKSAGFRRNADIVSACTRLVAFQVAGSKGTQHSIELARKAGKPVIVYTPEGEAA